MSGKYNNWILLAVFVVLAVVLVVTRFTGTVKRERSLNTEIVRIDTAKVSRILLYPRAEQGREMEFTRTGNKWEVSMDGRSVPGDGRKIESLLAELQQLRSQQLVARSPEKWTEFEVDDSLATRVVVKEGSETTLDLLVGRFSYQQPKGNNYNPYARNQVNGKTFVRLKGEDEVHAVEGFLAISMNQPLNRWRNATVSRFNKAQLSRLVFDYPADSGFVAERNGTRWMVAGMLSDSLSMDRFLNKVSRKEGQDFYDGDPPSGDPDFRLTMEGDNMEAVRVSAYPLDSTGYLVNSSLNPTTWFRATREGLFGELFPGADELLSGNGN
jgi:hypothetical protein